MPNTIRVFGNLFTDVDQDTVTKSFTIVQHPHEEIHDGIKWVTSDIVTLVQGATQKYLLIVPNTTKRIHMLYSISSTAQGQVQFFEAPSVSGNGTGMDMLVQNRNASTVGQKWNGGANFSDGATLQIFKGPTTTANGTQLLLEETGAGKATPGFTSADRNEHEFVLDQNNTYMLLLTATQATDFETHFHWYEV